jgi:hypothetical protein
MMLPTPDVIAAVQNKMYLAGNPNRATDIKTCNFVNLDPMFPSCPP